MLSQGFQRGALVDVFVARGALAGAQRGRLAANMAREAALAVAGVVALALSAHVIIPLPFTPVPVTGQTFAVLLLAAAYGARRGLASVALYLIAGMAGLPVFATAASAASYGYLVGFALAALVVGWLADRGWGRALPTSIAAMLAGEIAIYACALPWLARFVGWSHVIALGLTPFLIGDTFKLVAAALLLPAAWLATRRVIGEEPR
ncbi:MAG TPA: biotin transporter BioY [Ktedonobacterales bacterium]|jgi:biotin transport system substrate-specific component|nr:biotin transporter BioY [Ktedonobacterales bacterium]